LHFDGAELNKILPQAQKPNCFNLFSFHEPFQGSESLLPPPRTPLWGGVVDNELDAFKIILQYAQDPNEYTHPDGRWTREEVLSQHSRVSEVVQRRTDA